MFYMSYEQLTKIKFNCCDICLFFHSHGMPLNHADHADQRDYADHRDHRDHADHADNADHADHADHADIAHHALVKH